MTTKQMIDHLVDEELRRAISELPRWAVRVDSGMWVAVSPTYTLDGLVIHGRTVDELIQRVRLQVAVEALAMGRQGRRPPGGVLCGVDFTTVLEAAEPDTLGRPWPPGFVEAVQRQDLAGVVAAIVSLYDAGHRTVAEDAGIPGPPAFVDPFPSEVHQQRPAPMPQGRAAGYEGDPCPECQAMTLVRNGPCMKCMNCGSTTGCS